MRDQAYRLIEEVFGVSFAFADQIGDRWRACAPTTPQRIWAGVKHVLGEAAADGHTWLPQDALLAAATRLLGQPRDAVAAALARMVQAEQITVEAGHEGGEVVYPGALYKAELFVAGAIKCPEHRTRRPPGRLRQAWPGARCCAIWRAQTPTCAR